MSYSGFDLRNKLRRDVTNQPFRRGVKRRYSQEYTGETEEDFSSPRSRYDNFNAVEKEKELRRVLTDVQQRRLFSDDQCTQIERKIDEVVQNGENDVYKSHTVDRAPLRNKYFFGEGYTYGSQMSKKGPGQERLYPKGEVDEIPKWIEVIISSSGADSVSCKLS